MKKCSKHTCMCYAKGCAVKCASQKNHECWSVPSDYTTNYSSLWAVQGRHFFFSNFELNSTFMQFHGDDYSDLYVNYITTHNIILFTVLMKSSSMEFFDDIHVIYTRSAYSGKIKNNQLITPKMDN